MDALRTSEEYQKGVEEFIEFAERNAPSKNGKYPSPCVKCANVDCKSLEDIRDLAWGIGNYHETCKSNRDG